MTATDQHMRYSRNQSIEQSTYRLEKYIRWVNTLKVMDPIASVNGSVLASAPVNPVYYEFYEVDRHTQIYSPELTIVSFIERIANGLFLCKLIEKLSRKKILGINKKPMSLTQASSNIEKALQILWKQGVVASNMPEPRHIYNQQFDKVVNLFHEIFEVYVMRKVRKSFPTFKKWFLDINASYGRLIFKNANFWNDFRDGVSFIVIFHSLTPVEQREDKFQIFWSPADDDELSLNIEYAFSLMEAYDITVMWEVNEYLQFPDLDFLMYQMYIMWRALRHEHQYPITEFDEIFDDVRLHQATDCKSIIPEPTEKLKKSFLNSSGKRTARSNEPILMYTIQDGLATETETEPTNTIVGKSQGNASQFLSTSLLEQKRKKRIQHESSKSSRNVYHELLDKKFTGTMTSKSSRRQPFDKRHGEGTDTYEKQRREEMSSVVMHHGGNMHSSKLDNKGVRFTIPGTNENNKRSRPIPKKSKKPKKPKKRAQPHPTKKTLKNRELDNVRSHITTLKKQQSDAEAAHREFSKSTPNFRSSTKKNVGSPSFHSANIMRMDDTTTSDGGGYPTPSRYLEFDEPVENINPLRDYIIPSLKLGMETPPKKKRRAKQAATQEQQIQQFLQGIHSLEQDMNPTTVVTSSPARINPLTYETERSPSVSFAQEAANAVSKQSVYRRVVAANQRL